VAETTAAATGKTVLHVITAGRHYQALGQSNWPVVSKVLVTVSKGIAMQNNCFQHCIIIWQLNSLQVNNV